MTQTIGSRIAKYRKARNMTQEELAQRLGVSSQAVSKWENDVSCPDISLLPTLCQTLGISSDELLTGKTERVQMLPQEQRRTLDQLTLRMYINSAGGDRVKLSLPMRLVKVFMEMGLDMGSTISGNAAVKNVDVEKIVELAEQGVIGKLMEVESADGDTIEVVVE